MSVEGPSNGRNLKAIASQTSIRSGPLMREGGRKVRTLLGLKGRATSILLAGVFAAGMLGYLRGAARLEATLARGDEVSAEDTRAEQDAPIPADSQTGSLSARVDALPEAKEQVTVDLGGGVTMEFIPIRPGSFMMGSDSGTSDEKPAHKVTITKPFHLGKYEVTQAQWQAVMGGDLNVLKDANNPVENVSWNDCQEFLTKLNQKVKGGVFRLPTEAEWEYACRAGTTTRYSFNDVDASLGVYAWHNANGEGRTHPVGTLKPNPWGLYDMHGNVWEWCSDWKGEYAAGNVTDPEGASSGSSRVLRGGSRDDHKGNCCSATRGSNTPASRLNIFGVRVARNIE